MSEKYRPNLHFSPATGWMNDPNGMIRVDGVWHLFFQHDPDRTTHGIMHWGHASSRDLLHWDEHPVALYPTELGACFSGSAIETDEGAIKLFYTGHRLTNDGEDYQLQCLVHADRALHNFVGEQSNPVVPNPSLIAFRDPKVVWHAPSDKWIMLVTEGQQVGFYGSTNLTDWTRLSGFGEGHGRHVPEPWECPDMVPMTAPNGETFWVLIVGVNPGGYALGSGTQYFIGQFDGTKFINANAPETTLWLDYGRDYYAAQTFFERGGVAAPVAMAWASNWLYANFTPTEAFRSTMSLPRALGLVQTAQGLRLCAQVPQAAHQAIAASALPGTGVLDLVADLDIGETMTITLFGESAPHFLVHRTTADKGRIQTVRAARDNMREFGHDYDVAIDWPDAGGLDLTIYLDRGLVEFSASKGLVWLTQLFFPDDPAAPARVERIRA